MARIYGKQIMLREYKKEDLESIRKWCNNPKITNNLSDIFLFTHSLTQTEKFLNSMLDGGNQNYRGFVISDIKTEEYIGQIDLINIDWKNRVALMGIVIGEEEKQGKGYGYKAIEILQKFVFESLNLNKLELDLHDYNEKAYNCYLKCGFKEEGRLRQKFYINGHYTDMIHMGILRSEYEKKTLTQE
jgi:RimJ/RimL family protein N-acetyltransferase